LEKIMPTQVTIKAADMRSAGWVATHTVEPVRVEQCDCTGELIQVGGAAWTTWRRLFDGVCVVAYHSDDFVADCRYGGENEARFERLGLLSLPHTKW
jgi:hypothetical protein